ncbi:hypothetical protein M422DRAFT_37384, partial [Sphaerobolus stellatus SS14]
MTAPGSTAPLARPVSPNVGAHRMSPSASPRPGLVHARHRDPHPPQARLASYPV